MSTPYSEHHKVPTIEKFRQDEEARERAAAANASRIAQSADEEKVGGLGAAPALQQGTASDPTQQGEGLRQRRSGAESSSSGSGAPGVPPKDDGNMAAGQPSGGGAAEKERLKQAAQAPQGKPTDFQAKGRRRVTDPTTGGEVEIEDQVDRDIPVDALESKKPGAFSSRPPKIADNYKPLFVGPSPAEPTNILLQPFPAPIDTDAFARLEGNFRNLGIALAAALAVVWFFTAFGAGYFRFVLRTGLLVGVGVGGAAALGLSARKIEQDLEAVRAQMHAQRGQAHSLNDTPLPESAEWLNALIQTVWKQISPDMFLPLSDSIEDTMAASLPGVVDHVKVTDLTHGAADSALRITHFRGLADRPGEKDYPREEWIDQGRKAELKPKEQPGAAAKKDDGKTAGDSDGDGVNDEDEAGSFLNMEVGFTLQKRPGQKTKAASLMLSFYLGMFDLFRAPLNVWAEITGLSGTARLRIQFVEQAPFVRNLTITMMGVPSVHVNVVPMSRALPNVLDLPLISGFVKSSIAAALNEYVAPKSMTLNLADMLSGAPPGKDVNAIGVLVVHIQRGINLSAQDASGSSDPYVVISLAKFGKPLFSSRIIFESLEPNFNEYAFVPITKDDLANDEVLSVQLWDSDKRTADDIVGRISRNVGELTKGETRNKMVDYLDDLKGFEDADKMQGSLKWRCGFFEKAAFDKELYKKAKQARLEAMDKAERKAAEQAEETAKKQGNEEEISALNCPPSDAYPSGILSVTVHHCIGLETREVEKGVSGKERERGSSGQDVEEKDLEQNLPSGYAELVYGDSIVYRTRAKIASNFPIWEAQHEAFVRDWRSTPVRIVVRDSRVRENDPVLGICDISLPEILTESSTVTRYFALQDGVGYGKVHATVCWRSITLSAPRDIPKSLLGADTATVELLSAITLDVQGEHEELRKEKISVTTGDVTQKLSPVTKQEGLELGEDEQDNGFLTRLPVYDRHSSLLSFSFGGQGLLGGKVEAVAVVSLLELEDDETYDLSVPLLAGKNLGTLARNHIDEETAKTHDFEEIGTLHVKLRVNPGLDADHAALAKGQTRRHEFEVWNRIEGMPKAAEKNAHADDDGVIDRKERKAIQDAKTQALHSRHRGSYGYAPVRTAAWAKQGMKDRVRKMSLKIRGKKDTEREVASEA